MKTYPDRMFLKALVIMIIHQVHTQCGLLAILEQPTAEMQWLRKELSLPDGRFACRRTWKLRLDTIPEFSRTNCLFGLFSTPTAWHMGSSG